MISRFAKVLATGLPHTINVTGSLPTITITAKEFRLAESRLIFGTEKGGADKEKSIGTTESQLQHTGCTVVIKCVQDQVLETTHRCLLVRNMLKTTPGCKWVTLLHKCLKVEVFYGFFV